MNSSIFHLSFPVRDIESTKEFYVVGLGCRIGRQSAVAMMLDFHGHQIVAQVTEDLGQPQKKYLSQTLWARMPNGGRWDH